MVSPKSVLCFCCLAACVLLLTGSSFFLVHCANDKLLQVVRKAGIEEYCSSSIFTNRRLSRVQSVSSAKSSAKKPSPSQKESPPQETPSSVVVNERPHAIMNHHSSQCGEFDNV